MPQTKNKIYDAGIDMLRIIAIFAVVMIHTTTRELELTHYDLVHQTATLFLNQASRFAVPLFFMISGFVLELSYSNHQNYVSYIKKRLGRIFIPYIIWTIIYYFFIYTKHSGNFLDAVLTGSSSYQLYFIPALLIFYLIYPVVHRLYGILSNKWVVAVLFAVEMYLLNYDYQFHGSPIYYPIAVFLFNYFVFLIGIIAARNREKLRKVINKAWPIFLIGAGYLAYFVFNEGRSNYLHSYNYLDFYSQWRPSILIYTIFIFGSLYFITSRNIFNSKITKTLSSVSFFVFFVHVIVLEVVWKYVYANDALFFASVVGISLVIGYVVHKVPYLAKISG